MYPYLFSIGSEANVKQCVLFVSGRPTGYLLFINIIRNKTCTFRISYNISKASRVIRILAPEMYNTVFSYYAAVLGGIIPEELHV